MFVSFHKIKNNGSIRQLLSGVLSRRKAGSLITIFIVLVFILATSLQAHLVSVVVESVRKDSLTLISDIPPTQNEYTVYRNGKDSFQIQILSVQKVSRTGKTMYRLEARLDSEIRLRSGETLSLRTASKSLAPAYRDAFGKDKEYFLPVIMGKDNREMVLVPKGTALIGIKRRGSDAYPEHSVELDTFYIDKYEVSNRDFLVYVKEANERPPLSWEDGAFPQKLADCPVIVTYTEAEGYARWAEKRLPTEFEWEKAANGLVTPIRVITEMGIEYQPVKTFYPWGDDSNFSGTNSLEFWKGQSVYGKYNRGVLPVTEFSEMNKSAYGAVNMSGNAAEWTSSWYEAYEGNRSPNKRFGRQVKCIRGGSFAQGRGSQTTFYRSFGGLPSLSTDSAAGFRCVKVPDKADMNPSVREALP